MGRNQAFDVEVGKRLLRALYILEDNINFARSRVILKGEEERVQEIERTLNLSHNKAIGTYRWKLIENSLVDFQEALLEAQAMWNREQLAPLAASIFEIVTNFGVSSNLYYTVYETPDFKDPAFCNLSKVIYEATGHDQPDLFAEKLTSSVKALETFTKSQMGL